MSLAHSQPSARSPVHHCSICARKFARTEHLVRHERTHTKEKPFHCSLCTQSFARQDLLRRHEKKSHSAWAPTQSSTSPHVQLPQSPPDNTSPRSNEIPYQSSSPPHELMSTQEVSNLPEMSIYDLQDHGEWSNAIMGQLAPVEFDIDLAVQDCFLPDDLSWLDSCLASSENPGINITLGETINGHHDNHEGSSILSRPSSPLPTNGKKLGFQFPCVTTPSRSYHVTDEIRQRVQLEVAIVSEFYLPSSTRLSQYIDRYFQTFHQHMPFLHQATWSPKTAATPLFLAMCANGALYSLDRKTALSLHKAAVAMLTPQLSGLCALQSTMLLIAFAAWSDDVKDLGLALKLRGGITLILRQEWSSAVNDVDLQYLDWEGWVGVESRKRVTLCLFTLFNLIQVAYDVPSPLLLDDQYGMPSSEVRWRAETREEWLAATVSSAQQEWKTANGIIQRLGDKFLPLPTNIGMFGCHLIVSTLLQKIMLLRQSSTSSVNGLQEVHEKYIGVLRRWQMMWEKEPESSLSPENPRGPILFNSTALLRVSYIRLVIDFSPIRRAFSCYNSIEDIEAKINIFDTPLRDSQATRAALQACLALRIPVRLGFKVVARTSFWIWSVQHALCYFECALLLAKWLQVVQKSVDLSLDERIVLKLAQELVMASTEEEMADENQRSLPSGVLRSWAKLLDTADTTVWRIQPKMAAVLRLHADRLSST